MVKVGVPFIACVSTAVRAAFGGDLGATPPTATVPVVDPPTTHELYFRNL